MKITLLYQVSHYIRVKKQRNIEEFWDQSKLPRYKRILLYPYLCVITQVNNYQELQKCYYKVLS